MPGGFAEDIVDKGRELVQGIVYRTVPNLGLFFVVDALISSEITIPIDYLFRVSLYAFLLICALLSVAVALFQTREVG